MVKVVMPALVLLVKVNVLAARAFCPTASAAIVSRAAMMCLVVFEVFMFRPS